MKQRLLKGLGAVLLLAASVAFVPWARSHLLHFGPFWSWVNAGWLLLFALYAGLGLVCGVGILIDRLRR